MLVLASALMAGPAWADAVRIELFTKVAVGQRPRIKVTANQAVQNVNVELNRDDGKLFSTIFGTMAAGWTREISLDGGPGKSHYAGRVSFTAGGQTGESRIDFDAIVAPPLAVAVDKARVDLPGRKLEVKLSRPPARVTIKVVGGTGGEPVETEHDFTGSAAGETLTVTWPALAGNGEVARIDLRLFDVDGFFTSLSLFPWSVHIPHEEVNFATDSAAIAAAEQPKIESSLQKIADALAKHRDLGPVKLYIAGHTDTVGAAPYNLKLSGRRAQAIAGAFRKRGLRIPIFYEGFGEHAPLVSTPDETDEPKNRRVDYILAAEEPTLKTTGFRALWKRIP